MAVRPGEENAATQAIGSFPSLDLSYRCLLSPPS
jgi:hypothetical protein